MIDLPRRQLEEDPGVGSTWNRDEVRRPLWERHLRKCYLCEGPIPLADFEVDHRVPQSVCPTLIHCWFNLFPSHGRCNRRRGSFPWRGGLLSPGLDRDLEGRLQQRVERIDSCEVRARFTATDPADLYAVNTANELERIHSPTSATTDTAREGAQALLDAVTDRYREKVYPLEIRALRARRRGHPDRRVEDQLRRALGRDEPFTMLVRSMVSPELAELVED